MEKNILQKSNFFHNSFFECGILLRQIITIMCHYNTVPSIATHMFAASHLERTGTASVVSCGSGPQLHNHDRHSTSARWKY